MAGLAENTVIIGERDYESAIDQVIASARSELLIFDQDLTTGAYRSVQRFEHIRTFLTGNARPQLTIVLQDAKRLTSELPRLYGLLETYGHLMQVYETNDSAKIAKDCFVIADSRAYSRRFHIDQARFKFSMEDAETANMLKLRFGELLEATSQRITFTTLGL